MSDDDLNDELGPFSRLRLSQQKQHITKPPPVVNMNKMEDLFLNLSVSKDGEISLATLEAVVSHMKANAQNSISLTNLLTELNISKDQKSNHEDKPVHSKSSSKSNTQGVDVDDIVFESSRDDEVDDEVDEESISSSVNSSWIESPFKPSPTPFAFQSSPLHKPSTTDDPSPPVKFDFKTPQKLFHGRKNKTNVLEEVEENKNQKKDTEEENEGEGSSNTTHSPGFVVDSSPPPNFFDRNISASAAGSVFGPPDDALLPNKHKKTGDGSDTNTNTDKPPPPVSLARTLFSTTETTSTSKAESSQGQTDTFLTSSLFTGQSAPTVMFDMGKSSDKSRGGQKAGKRNPKSRGGGKAHMSQNLPTTNFQAFPPHPPPVTLATSSGSQQSSQQSTATPLFFNNTLYPPRREEQDFPSPSPMDMEQSPNDNTHTRDTDRAGDINRDTDTNRDTDRDTDRDLNNTNTTASFSFSMGSGTASSSKPKSSTKSQRKNRRGKTSPASTSTSTSTAADPHTPQVPSSDSSSSTASSSSSSSSFYTSPIKNRNQKSPFAPPTEQEPEAAEQHEVDARMVALAELFKKEGKSLYSCERYDM